MALACEWPSVPVAVLKRSLFLLWIILSVSEALECFSCAETSNPGHCRETATCPAAQECFVDFRLTSTGAPSFSLGCRTRQLCTTLEKAVSTVVGRQPQLTACSKCCDTNYCNRQFCLENLPNPTCFSCTGVGSLKSCDTISVCQKDEKCFSSTTFNLGLRQELYSGGCMKTTACARVHQQYVNHSISCVSCCDGHYCNQQGCDVDECQSGPCHHGATCTDHAVGFSCSCAPGFRGDNCEINIDECASSPCQNGGTCLDLKNRFHCLCPLGFMGHDCQIVDHCYKLHCLHGGTCLQKQGGTCVCVEGFMGSHCQQAVTAARLLTQGKRQQTSSRQHSSRDASCDTGGTRRATRMDHCVNVTCLNGGTCVHSTGQCNCPFSFVGQRCQKACVFHPVSRLGCDLPQDILFLLDATKDEPERSIKLQLDFLDAIVHVNRLVSLTGNRAAVVAYGQRVLDLQNFTNNPLAFARLNVSDVTTHPFHFGSAAFLGNAISWARSHMFVKERGSRPHAHHVIVALVHELNETRQHSLQHAVAVSRESCQTVNVIHVGRDGSKADILLALAEYGNAARGWPYYLYANSYSNLFSTFTEAHKCTLT